MISGDKLRYDNIVKYTDEQLKEMTFICVDVSGKNPIDKKIGREKLSKYFSVYEAASQDGCPVLLYNSETLDYLDLERDDIGPTTMTSGHRSLPWNTHEGGTSESRHLYGDGYDHKNKATPLQQMKVLEKYDGTHNNAMLIYNTFLHLDRGRTLRKDYT